MRENICPVHQIDDLVCGQAVEMEIVALKLVLGEAREVLKKIAKPALGGKQQQWWAQEFLSKFR